MNKIFTFSALLLSGAIIGSIAGRLNNNSESLKFRRTSLTNNIKSVRNFMKKSEDDDMNEYFI